MPGEGKLIQFPSPERLQQTAETLDEVLLLAETILTEVGSKPAKFIGYPRLVEQSSTNVDEPATGFDERIISALGDPALKSFVAFSLDTSKEAPVNEQGEQYTETSLVSELSKQHKLPHDVSATIYFLVRGLAIKNNTEAVE